MAATCACVLQLVEYACADFFVIFSALRLQSVMLSHLNMIAATCACVLQLIEYACADFCFIIIFGALRLQGVMLSHLNMMAATCACVLQLGEYAPKRTDILFSFLPLAHTLER
jgi:hypothetical protein